MAGWSGQEALTKRSGRTKFAAKAEHKRLLPDIAMTGRAALDANGKFRYTA